MSEQPDRGCGNRAGVPRACTVRGASYTDNRVFQPCKRKPRKRSFILWNVHSSNFVNDGRIGGRFRRLKWGQLVWLCLVCLFLDVGGRQTGHCGVSQSVGGALQCDDFGVVDDAVDHGGGDGVVPEDFSSAAEGQVAGEDH